MNGATSCNICFQSVYSLPIFADHGYTDTQSHALSLYHYTVCSTCRCRLKLLTTPISLTAKIHVVLYDRLYFVDADMSMEQTVPRNRKTKTSERNGTSGISTDAGGNTSSGSTNTDKSGCCMRYCHLTDCLLCFVIMR